MRVSGGSNEGLMSALPIAALIVVAMVILGGPSELLSFLDSMVERFVNFASVILAALF
jgi:hypothetical protein